MHKLSKRMEVPSSGYLKKNAIINYLSLLMVLFFFSGCDLIGGLSNEAKEEKNILGYAKGYNPKTKEIQKILKEAGIDPGSIEGVMHKQTRQAIRDFQRKNKIKESGFIDIKTKAKLDSISLKLVKKKQQLLQPQEIENRLKSPAWIKKIQQALKNAGFGPGLVNGKIDEKTKNAIVAFQKSKGLIADGKIGPKTWDELSKYFPKD